MTALCHPLGVSGGFRLVHGRDGRELPALGRGSVVALVQPAGPVADQAVARALALLEERGYVPRLMGAASTAGDAPSLLRTSVHPPYLAASDGRRMEALQRALTTPGIHGVWALRGGYGCARILQGIDWRQVSRAEPRWLIGFSDITALLLAAAPRFPGLPIHGPNAGALYRSPPTDFAPLFNLLEGNVQTGTMLMPPVVGLRHVSGHPGGETISGRAVAANLCVLAHMAGTDYAPDLNGAVLFLEDVGEAPYRIDRALTQLRHAGILDGVKAVVLGEFRHGLPAAADPSPDNNCPQGKTNALDPVEEKIQQAALHALAGTGIPLLAGFPSGHGSRNRAVPIGAKVSLAGTPPVVSFPVSEDGWHWRPRLVEGSGDWSLTSVPRSTLCQAAASSRSAPAVGSGGEQPSLGTASQGLERIDELLRAAVDEGVLPGGVCLAGSASRLLYCGRVGWAHTKPVLVPIHEGTVFDLASLTKPLVTAAAVMAAHTEGRLDPDMKVGQVFPSWAGAGARGRVKVCHLLSHSSGLPAWLPIYKEILSQSGDTPLSSMQRREAGLDLVLAQDLEAEPGERTLYSDLGYILLYELLARVLGEEPHQYVQRRIWGPLGLTSLAFHTLGSEGGWSPTTASSSLLPPTWAATEECPWRGKVLAGEVHDDNAHAMGGVAGHAGLFGNALDVFRFGAAMLRAGAGKLPGLMAGEVVQRFFNGCRCGSGSAGGAAPTAGTGALEATVENTWAMGWDRPSREGPSSAGTLASPSARGHLGFTGTSLWLDPERDGVVVLLTNRVHYGRDESRIRQLRPALHDIFWKYLDEQG